MAAGNTIAGQEQSRTALQGEALFRSIVDDLPEQVMVIDREGAPIFANKALRSERGGKMPKNEAEWRKAYEIYSADGSRRLAFEEWPLARALRGERVQNMELRSRDAKGRDAIMLVSGEPRRDEAGALIGAIVTARNITALRRTEDNLRQSQKLELMGQLTSSLAHDLNNILLAITTSVDVLKRAVAGDERLALAAATVERAADNAVELTRHLLAFARKQSLQPVALDIGNHVRESLPLLRTALGPAVKIEIDCAGPVLAVADPTQLTSALLNLCLNARDAMTERGGAIKIKIDKASEPVGVSYARLSVSDSGCGMSEETAKQATAPFFTTKPAGKGTGLGLSVVYGFARQSGGALSIESAEGKGTTVTLLLPHGAGV